MLRYRVAKDPAGHYFVLPALVGVVSLDETYSNRTAARQTADWYNGVVRRERFHRAGSAVDDEPVSVPIRVRRE
jgi:hypothetical protein